MADELKVLLERLQRDGVDAGRQQADALLQQARAEAARIVAEARQEADRQLAAARSEAEVLAQRTRASLQQAARDLLLVVGQRIEDLVRRLVADRVAAALDGPTVLRLATHLIDGFVARGRATGSIELVVGQELRQVLTDGAMHALGERLQHGLTLHLQHGLDRGFQLRMGDGGVTHDFTGPALAAALAELVTPQIAAIVLEAAVGKPASGS